MNFPRGETQAEQRARLNAVRRKKVTDAADSFLMEVVTPTHPVKEHYHGDELRNEVSGLAVSDQDQLEDQ